MPPPAQDSQGLKIAVAAFVSLTVILAVTAYFLYSSYSQTYEKLVQAEQNVQAKTKAADEALRQSEELLKRIGSRAEGFEAATAEIKAKEKEVDDEIGGLIAQTNESITKLQAAGATGPEIEDAKTKVQQISAAYLSEPNKNYISSMSRLKDLLRTLVMLDLEICAITRR